MAKMVEMMKQVKQLKKMQKELKRKVVSAASPDGSVTVEACGDMTIKSITISPEAMSGMDPKRLGDMVARTVNSAMDSAKKAAAGDMSKLAGDAGLGGMFGG
ncbi:MAG: YbaB/EbfC family nucleoid-associated protein [Verrucomicrobia bacterium]|jgi:nucleoid-associated protein EbfC|nr:YbaB/EbfC family nucleoid-associated protein [Verrucomicrobiota bacterium]MBT7067203.1 YbaB/EbfC family nucleoid-associated protein [Verrucomicrobiota bacterium]MBT7701125.1 YbaB/EbfC family nucleoid-associated protein [Verrucomicrobiota bacterium]